MSTTRALLLALGLWAGAASAQMVIGQYVGTGGTYSVSGLGFRPDLVMIKGDLDTGATVKTASMPGNESKVITSTTLFMQNDAILSLDADGFTVGVAWRVNKAGTDFFYLAAKALPGALVEGRYLGDAGVEPIVSGLGFQPDAVLLMSERDVLSYLRTAEMPDGLSAPVGPYALYTDRIKRFTADGFQVGSSSTVNAGGVDHYYIAFKSTPELIATGKYQGNAQDNRSITGVGFEPQWVWTKPDTTAHHVWRPSSMSGDFSFRVDAAFKASNLIQSLDADGFTVGTAAEVNGLDAGVYWLAWRAPPDGGVDSGVPDAGIGDGGLVDAGTFSDAGVDGGVMDAGEIDGGLPDGGSVGPDAGAPDAGAQSLPPVAVIDPPHAELEIGGSLQLSAAGSTSAVTHLWEWVEGPTGLKLAAGPTQSLTFTEPGRYRLSLIVVDALDRVSAPAFARIEVRGSHATPDPRLSGCAAGGAAAPASLLALLALVRRLAKRR